MKPFTLKVRIPIAAAFLIEDRLLYDDSYEEVETMVHALRRIGTPGEYSEEFIMAMAFVTEKYRGHLRYRGRLIDGMYAWCKVEVKIHRKSLGPFMASGERECKTEGEE